MRADFLEILETPSLSGFPKFLKWPDLVDRIFQNISLRADLLEIREISEIFEIRKVRGENFGNFGVEFGRADRHPSEDRPCTTTQLRGHGLSRGGGRPYTYIYICMHACTTPTLGEGPMPKLDQPLA